MAVSQEPFATEQTAASAHLPTGPAQRGWRRFDRLIVAGFVIGLLVPGLVMATGLKPAAVENRPLYTLPAFSASGLINGTLTASLDAFLIDNIYFRPWAIRTRGEFAWATGGTGTTAVVRGRDGWLFIDSELKPLCGFPAGTLLKGLGPLIAAFDAAGQEFRFVPAPDKHAIYPEMVTVGLRPESCSESGRATVRAGLAALAPQAIESWAALEGAKASGGPWTPETTLYFQKDSHWAPAGAIVIIEDLIRSIDPDVWSAARIDRSGMFTDRQDLAKQMGIERTEVVTRIEVLGPPVVREDLELPPGVPHDQPLFTMSVPASPSALPGRTLIIHDSYFGSFYELVAPFFVDSTWVHVNDAVNHHEVAAALGRFDRVIFERVERYLYANDYVAALEPYVR